MDRSKIGQFFKDTFKKDDSNTPVKFGIVQNIDINAPNHLHSIWNIAFDILYGE